MNHAEELETSIMEKVSPIGFQVADGKSAKDLAGEAQGMRLGPIVERWLEDPDFPMERETSWQELVPVVLERDMTEEEVLELLKRRGLERPVSEDVLRAAVFYPNRLEGLEIVFPHDPHEVQWYGKVHKIILGFEFDLAGCALLAYNLASPETFKAGKVVLARCPAHKS